jgi:hypothetical protein
MDDKKKKAAGSAPYAKVHRDHFRKLEKGAAVSSGRSQAPQFAGRPGGLTPTKLRI